MRHHQPLPLATLLLSFVLQSTLALTQTEPDKTESPYFLILNDKTELSSFPLKFSGAEVNIAGVIAEVTVTQVYQNTGDDVIEAVYVFPASTRAAVYNMRMTVGKRVIEAVIKEKTEARNIYEEAKSEGKTASLLEQQRPNIFQMNVANILPGDSIVINMSYTELLVPENGLYEFVYPTVVGPRYTGEKNARTNLSQDGKRDEQGTENPHTKSGVAPTYDFGLQIHLNAGLPISSVSSPSHAISIETQDADAVTINLDSSEVTGGNRDFILKYSLRDNQIQNGMLAYKGNRENFFLLMMQPPVRVEQEMVAKREYIFVVDVSGSMSGFPLNISKELLRNLVGSLNEEDLFNVILFAAGNEMLSPESLKANQRNIFKAIDLIDHQQGGGGTHLYAAMQQALALPETPGYSKTIVICTDGYVDIEPETFSLIRKSLDKANIFAFGIGTSVNRYLIEGIAYTGHGEPFVVTSEMEAGKAAKQFKEYVESPLLTDIQIDFGSMDVYDVEPVLIHDLFADRPLILFGKYKGTLSGAIKITGKNGSGDYTNLLQLEKVKPSDKNKALRYLWARERIKLLSDYGRIEFDGTRAAAVTQLGLEYNLLTDYTSFVAVYKKARTDEPADSTIKQLLPLPAGVPNSAIGEDFSSLSTISGQGINSYQKLSCVVIAYNAPLVSSSSCISAIKKSSSSEFTSHYTDFFLPQDFRSSRTHYLVNGLSVNNGLSASNESSRIPYSWMDNLTIYYARTNIEDGFGSPYGIISTNLWNNAYENNFSTGVEATHFGEVSGYFNGAYRMNEEFAGKLLFYTKYAGAQLDFNKDNFLDIPQSQNYQLFNSWKYEKNTLNFSIRKIRSELGVLYSYLNEREGERDFKSTTNADTLSRYRAETENSHLALFTKTSLFLKPGTMRLDITGTLDDLQATYGLKNYNGRSNDFGTKLQFNSNPGTHSYVAGIAYQASDYSEQLDLLIQARVEHIIGFFGKYQFDKNKITSNAGARFDYHNSFGWFWSPSATMNYRLGDRMNITATVDRRYRVPKVFAENLSYANSSRTFTLEDAVLPEESWHFNGGFTYRLKYDIALGASYERVQFENKLVTDLDAAQQVVIYNSAGRSFENRIRAFALYKFKDKLEVEAHYTFNAITTAYKRGNDEEQFVPNHTLTVLASYTLSDGTSPKWKFALAGNLTGKQRIPDTGSNPEQYRVDDESPCFFLLDAQISKYYRKWKFYVGAANLLNFRMEQPVIASDQPFSSYFDASLVWGPVPGAKAYAGFTYQLHK